MSLFPTEIVDAVRFFVDHAPVPQPRQRHRVVMIRGRKPFVQNYTPADHPVQLFKDVIRFRAKMEYNGPMFEGPLRVHLLFLLERPERLVWKTKPMPRLWCPGRPDIDNYAKAVMDALKGHLFRDDAQVVDLHGIKMYCAGDESPGVECMVEALT